MSRLCTALYGKADSCTLLYAGFACRMPIWRSIFRDAVNCFTKRTKQNRILRMKLKTAVQLQVYSMYS